MTTVAGRRRVLPSSTGYWVVAVTFCLTMLGTTLPTPLYPLYQQRYGFGGLTTTIVFATYAGGVALALLFSGRLSDQIGRRGPLLTGLGLAAASALVFLLPGMVALFTGRLLSGLSAGLFTGTATAALVELAGPRRRARAGLVAAVVNMLGLGLGPVVAGLLAEVAPAPLVLPYVTHLVLVSACAVALWFVPETVEGASGPVRLRVQRISVPAEVRGVFVRSAIAGFAGFAVLGLFTGVSPAVLGQVLHVGNHLVTGVVVFVVFGGSAIGQVLSARAPDRVALLSGCLGLVVGVAGVGVAIATASLLTLVLGAVVAGIGQGALFRAGLSAVSTGAPAEQRGEVTSAFFLVLYVALAIPIIGVGAAAAAFGMVTAGVVFAGVVAALALAAFVSLLRRDA